MSAKGKTDYCSCVTRIHKVHVGKLGAAGLENLGISLPFAVLFALISLSS